MGQRLFESLLENNPLRARVRENMEVKVLREATDVGAIPHALHIACGNGGSTQQLLRYFAPARLSAVDRDEELVAAARARYPSETVDYSCRDVRALGFEAGSFDAVFDLADLHNTADWRTGLAEIHRVLKRGGLFILEELSRETFSFAAGKFFKIMTEHPYDSMLTVEEFRESILSAGFEILHFEEKVPFGLLKYFVMVARKG